MSNDGTHKVGALYEAVQLAGVDITGGTYTLTARNDKDVFLTRQDSAPTHDNPGAYVLSGVGSGAKYLLSATEKIYARTGDGSAIIGVIES